MPAWRWLLLAWLAHAAALDDFYFPTPEELNITETNFTWGYNPWMPKYSYDASKTYFTMIAEDCLPEEEGGGRIGAIPEGWWDTCEDLGIDCHCQPAIWPDKWNVDNKPDRTVYGTLQHCAWEIRRALDQHRRGVIQLAGIAARCSMRDADIYDEAREVGVPVLVVGMNPPRPGEPEYGLPEPDGFIGNDEAFFGESMAKLLKRLLPQGGTYGFVMQWNGDSNNRVRVGFNDEMEPRLRDDKEDAIWKELPRYPYEHPYDHSVPCNHLTCQMEGLARNTTVDAILFLFESPIRNPLFKAWVRANRHRNLTLISSGSNELALDLLNAGYLQGVLGTAYYDFGKTAAKTLHEIAGKLCNADDVLPLQQKYFETPTLAHNLIPTDLDKTHPPQLHENLLGNLPYVGYVGYGIVVLSTACCMVWTYVNRSEIVVRSTQPFFLMALTVGIVIFASTVIPLSFDDSGNPESVNEAFDVAVCMSQPWLAFTGFTVIFSALFSKTWRVNKLLNTRSAHARVEVSPQDVMGPFAVLFTCNVSVLICWTLVDPLKYVRLVGDATDLWNREIESYGACRSDNAAAFLIPLSFINVVVLGIACWQAFEARYIESAFSESQYIAFSVAALFQTFLTGVPILAIVKSDPRLFYLVLTLMILVLSESILLLIFIPKMYTAYKFSKLCQMEQKRRMSDIISRSSNGWAARNSVAFSSNALSNGNNLQFGLHAAIVKISEEGMQESKDDSVVNC